MVFNLIHNWSFTFIPGFCLICGQQSRRRLDLCSDCETDLPWLNLACLSCGTPCLEPDTVCGACLYEPPSWGRGYFALRYEVPVIGLHRAFKFKSKLSVGLLLAELLSVYLLRHKDNFPYDVQLVTIPLHWRRHLTRGFNQAEIIAKHLSWRLEWPLIPALRRKKYTKPQHSLDNKKQRQSNLKHAFDVLMNVDGSHIVLVDDVKTTGATLNNASKTLFRAGAKSVDVCCIASTTINA